MSEDTRDEGRGLLKVGAVMIAVAAVAAVLGAGRLPLVDYLIALVFLTGLVFLYAGFRRRSGAG